MFEYLRHDWASLRAPDDPKNLPQVIQNLAQAQTKEEAERYYRQIDNTAFLQDSVYEVSYPVVICFMQELVRCTPVAREYILDLLDVICNGEPAPEEEALGNIHIVEYCVKELSRGINLLFDILERGTGSELDSSISLLFTCWIYDRSLNERLTWWYKRLISIHQDDHVLIQSLNNLLYKIEMNDPDV